MIPSIFLLDTRKSLSRLLSCTGGAHGYLRLSQRLLQPYGRHTPLLQDHQLTFLEFDPRGSVHLSGLDSLQCWP